jgi:hypothetical protein
VKKVVCRCKNCIEKEEELERLSAIKKLSPDEIHVLNKDKDRMMKVTFILGVLIGILFYAFCTIILR